MPSYLIKNTAIDAEGPELQTFLEHCYAAKLRPLCACKAPGVPMYISKIAGTYHIKRMPDTGAEHHVACESYAPPPELSGLGEVMGSAIKEDVESGLTSLRFDFALTKTFGRTAPTPSDVEHDSVRTDSTKLTIRALLHYLWDRSKLTHWQPAWQGKRSWGTIYKQLTHAANGNQAKGLSLADCLYVPQPFFVDRKDEIAGQRAAFLHSLTQTDGKTRRLGIIIGEVKAIENARYGFKIVFKQVPDYHFMLSEDAHKLIHKRFENELALWGAFDGSHLVAIATFGIGPTGLATIEEIALMLTTENWIPFTDLNEKNLIDRLTELNRRFIKGMRYNMSTKRPLASVELVDTSPFPTAMFITPADTDDAYKRDLVDLTDKSKLLQWVWDISSAMPHIPERTNKLMHQ
jgi:hypothetical protein